MYRNQRPLLLALVLSLALPLSVQAERPDHFKGKQSHTLEEALENLASYNKKLDEVLTKEDSLENIATIHQLTYTLESALEVIDTEAADIAAKLEELHLASERNDTTVVRQKATAYLDKSNELIRK
ncbi:MAG: hypothetical protein OQK94_08650 [Gammaproteobacteria bacterium]|nr:hypothetical protein [Gammaproteobacteria bacterium]MCW8841235.1 hypothetical protein [Gammaproteobacteria bacterium]MCW8972287.1 hypothetical protein [Gammaproteobacteria bacterium]MCW8991882.1 hypothetical protein [Gammaproteobacteria bacterium]